MFDTHPTRTMPHHSANALASADFAKTQTHSAKTALFHRFSPNWSALWRPNPVKSRLRRHQSGGIALQEGATRRRHAARGLRVVQNPRHHRCGGCWRDRGPGCGAHEWRQGLAGFRDATTRPRPDKFRMQFPHGTIQHKPKNRRISTIRFQNLKYFQGNCMRNYRDAVRTRAIPRPGRAGVEDTGGSGGSEGLAAVPVGGGGAWLGFEATRRAKLAARTTRGRAAAHGHIKQPGTHTAHTAHTARGPKRRSASGPHAHACQLTG